LDDASYGFIDAVGQHVAAATAADVIHTQHLRRVLRLFADFDFDLKPVFVADRSAA
jgi:hypothetical protein